MNIEQTIEIIKTLPNVQETVNKLSGTVGWKGIRNYTILGIIYGIIVAILTPPLTGSNQLYFIIQEAIIGGIGLPLATLIISAIFWSILTHFGAQKEKFKFYYYITSIYSFPFFALTILLIPVNTTLIGIIIYWIIAIAQFYYAIEIAKVVSGMSHKKIAKAIVISFFAYLLILIIVTILVTATVVLFTPVTK